MTFIFGKLTNLIPKSLTHTVGDCHIYLNHVEPLKRQIGREPRPFPQLIIEDRDQQTIEDFEASDFVIEGYQPYPGIKMDMAV
jgi:thymidylate synthase